MELLLLPILTRVLLVGARVSMLMVFAPFLGSTAISGRIKIGATAALTVLLYPSFPVNSQIAMSSSWLRILIGEMAIGLLIGLVMQFVFEGALLAGQVLGFQMGYLLESAIDPLTQADTPVIATFHQSIVLLIFLQLNVHHWILRGLAKSFDYIGPGGVRLNSSTTTELFRVAGGIFLVGLQVAAPVLIATFLTDLALGFIGRATPQLPVLFIGIPMKNLVGLVVLWGCLAYWPSIFEPHFASALATTERLLHLAR